MSTHASLIELLTTERTERTEPLTPESDPDETTGTDQLELEPDDRMLKPCWLSEFLVKLNSSLSHSCSFTRLVHPDD